MCEQMIRDVAAAHEFSWSALRYFNGPAYNLGTGSGTSVLEVMDAVRQVTGIEFSGITTAPRPGDPEQVVGDPARIPEQLGRETRHDLASAVESAWCAWSDAGNTSH